MVRVTEYTKTCEFCHDTFNSPQSYSAHKRRRHPGWKNGTAAVTEVKTASEDEEGKPGGTLVQENFYCIYCREDLTILVRDLLAVGDASWEDFSYCPSCGRNIRKELLWATTGCTEGW